MKIATIIGHFGFGTNKVNGQTVKTKVIANALETVYGDHALGKKDTQGRWRFLIKSPLIIWESLWSSRNVIVLPAYKGVFVIVPILVLFNLFFRRTLHYVVIGGWLPDYSKRYSVLRFFLKRLNYIYVETHSMQKAMELMKFSNVCVMPNSKPITVIETPSQTLTSSRPFKLCTFSRVMQEKGIEDAITAVNACNQHFGYKVYELHIYGPVEQQEWFDTLMFSQPEEICYKGVVSANDSTQVLCNYFAMLFPTYYRGEAFAGTLIDAMAAGLPTIASDWHANTEIITDGETGFLFPTHSVESLTQKLIEIACKPELIQEMRSSCIKHALEYTPDIIIKKLTQRMTN